MQRESILEGSLIAEKIDLMRNSIAEISTLSKGKIRLTLHKLEEESKVYR